jgi:hypothetical protein
LYASIPVSDSIVALSVPTGTVTAEIPVGDYPNRMAMSGDGQFLYVGLDGPGAVRRVDLITPTATLEFPLVPIPDCVFSNPTQAFDIVVLADNPHTIVVSAQRAGFSGPCTGGAVYDNGIPRPVQPQYYLGRYVIEPSALPTTVYGFPSDSDHYQMSTWAITPDGVTITHNTLVLTDSLGADYQYSEGYLYGTNGAKIDPVAQTLLGMYPGQGPIVRDPEADRVYLLAPVPSWYPRKLLIFDGDTFTPTTTFEMSSWAPPLVGWPKRMVMAGDERLALLTDAGHVYLIQLVTLTPRVALPAVLVSDPATVVDTFPFVDRCTQYPIILGGQEKARMTMCVTSVEIRLDGKMKFNFRWSVQFLTTDIDYVIKGPDSFFSNKYVTDNQGRRYDQVQAGGAAAQFVYFYRSNNQPADGWFVFPPRQPDATTFTYHDDHEHVFIDNLTLIH